MMIITMMIMMIMMMTMMMIMIMIMNVRVPPPAAGDPRVMLHAQARLVSGHPV